MKLLRKFSILLFLLFIFLTGTVCASAKSNSLNMVTQIQVMYRHGNITRTRVYVQPHKIGSVLNYLRLLKPGGTTDADPEQLSGDCFEIILYDGNGQRSIYRQKANKFLSKNSHPWKRISQKQASLLYPLIQSIPTDIEKKNAE